MRSTPCLRRPGRCARSVCLLSRVLFTAAVCSSLVTDSAQAAATFSSDNFVIEADHASAAARLADVAETVRSQLAHQWLGQALPPATPRCRIICRQDPDRSSGQTSYELFRGVPEHVTIHVTGEMPEILECILPHEIAHAVIVQCTGRVVPRWADEGIAMMAERDSVQHSQLQYAAELLKGRDGDCLQQLMTRTQYPRDETRLLQFYARSYSLTAFLVQQGGHRRLVQFLRDAADHDWESALLQHYEYADLVTVQTAWVDWTNRQAAAEQVAVAESDTTH